MNKIYLCAAWVFKCSLMISNSLGNISNPIALRVFYNVSHLFTINLIQTSEKSLYQDLFHSFKKVSNIMNFYAIIKKFEES